MEQVAERFLHDVRTVARSIMYVRLKPVRTHNRSLLGENQHVPSHSRDLISNSFLLLCKFPFFAPTVAQLPRPPVTTGRSAEAGGQAGTNQEAVVAAGRPARIDASKSV